MNESSESTTIQRKRLDTQGRGTFSASGHWIMFLFGLPFAGVGAAITLIGMRVIEVNPSTVNAPYWVLGLSGLIFLLPGLFCMGLGIAGYRNGRRLARLREEFPEIIAYRDYPWHAEGDEKGPLRAILASIAAACFVGIFLAPFNYWMITDGSWILILVIGLFNLIFIAAVWGMIHTIWQSMKYGRSRLGYDRFPYHPGEVVEMTWSTAGGVGDYRKISFTLRCIEEERVTQGTGKNRRTVNVRYQLWSDEFVIDEPGRHTAESSIPLTFAIPEDLPGTNLSGNQPRYYLLQVEADTPGPDFKADYLVPIYPR